MSWQRALAVAALVTAWPATGAAHGREPMIGQIAFDPSDRDHFVLRGTWAFLTTRDGGDTFTWSCAIAIDYDRLTEDPPIAITASGRIAVGTFDGLRSSSARGCEYLDAPGDAWGTYAIDVQRDPHDDAGLWVAMSPGDRGNTLIHSTNEGESFEVAHTFEAGVLERVRVAPNDPMRIYVSGAIPRTSMETRHVFVFHSEDRGATFAPVEIPLTSEERNAHVVAVDPTDSDRALVRMTRIVTDEVPERLLLTEDGGRTFTTVLEALEIIAVVFSHDGERVWAGSWDGGFHRSDDSGRTFTTLDPDLRVRCLAERATDAGESELFVCVDELTNDYAVGRSYDGGESIAPMWAFSAVENVTGCDGCSVVGAVCPAYWPDVLYDIATIGGLDGGPLPGPTDAGPLMCGEAGIPFDASLPRPDAGMHTPTARCGCVAGGATRRRVWVLGLLLGFAELARRRRQR
ncbi:MAG: hypothetical protein J0L92_26615 [Deltaproteobacteria bacterium]|nr:hypothetical protein [Deltaproteobacteria bacterium]